MKSIKLPILINLMILSSFSFAQSPDKVEMADVLRQDGKIYTVVIGLVIILTAVIVLLLRVDRKIAKLEKGKDN